MGLDRYPSLRDLAVRASLAEEWALAKKSIDSLDFRVLEILTPGGLNPVACQKELLLFLIGLATGARPNHPPLLGLNAQGRSTKRRNDGEVGS